MNDFDASFNAQDSQQLIGEKEVEIRVWRREYAKLQALVARLEAEAGAQSSAPASEEPA